MIMLWQKQRTALDTPTNISKSLVNIRSVTDKLKNKKEACLTKQKAHVVRVMPNMATPCAN